MPVERASQTQTGATPARPAPLRPSWVARSRAGSYEAPRADLSLSCRAIAAAAGATAAVAMHAAMGFGVRPLTVNTPRPTLGTCEDPSPYHASIFPKP